MGIRIHKVLGYGLTNLQTDKKNGWKITDPRINPNGIMGIDYEERDERYGRQAFYKWLREKYEACGDDYSGDKLHLSWDMVEADHNHANSSKRCGNPSDCFIHYGEYGLPNVLTAVPYTCRWSDWYRFDNMIDYMEEGRGARGNRVVVYDDGLYPWIGQYWDVRTGEMKKGEVACAYRRLVNAEKDEKKSRKKNKEDFTSGKLALAQVMGFETLAECEENLQVMVPRCLQLMCEFCEVFTEPAMVRELRPMLYVYWS